jgi:DNA polymerase III subunit beta
MNEIYKTMVATQTMDAITPSQVTPSWMVHIVRADLLSALSHIQGVVERKTAVPILSHVFLQSTGEQVVLIATDLELTVHQTIEAQGDIGSTTLPMHTLYDIVRKLPDGSMIKITIDGGRAKIQAGSSRFTVNTLPAQDFPEVPNPTFDVRYHLPTHQLQRLISKTAHAMSLEETRYFLNGIYWHVTTTDDGVTVLRAVATDGHRLAQADTLAPDGLENHPAVILPRKMVNELKKLLESAPETLEIALSTTRIAVYLGTVHLQSKLIDGKYPEYKRVVPQNNKASLTVDTKALATIVDRVATIAMDKTKGVKFQIRPNHLTLLASSMESQNQGVEDIAVQYQGEDRDVGFNAKYLLEAVGQVDDALCVLWLGDMSSPIMLKGDTDTTSLFVLMPMRL